jgi:hypothetical protein
VTLNRLGPPILERGVAVSADFSRRWMPGAPWQTLELAPTRNDVALGFSGEHGGAPAEATPLPG